MSFLLNSEFFEKLEVSTSYNTDISPFADWMHGKTCDRSTQTNPNMETLLGRVILAHCPNPEILKEYVNHINTSRELVQLLKPDSLPEQQTRNEPSRSNE